MSEIKKNVAIEDLERELESVFDEISRNPDGMIVSQVPEKCKILLSRNIVFLRHYLGFEQFLKPYNQEDFAKLLNIALPTLKKWEGANNLPSRFSLKTILKLTNDILFGKEVVKIEHILCKNLVKFIKDVHSSGINDQSINQSDETYDHIAMIKKAEDLILRTLNAMNEACLIIQDSQIVFANNSAVDLFSGNDVLEANYTISDLLLPNIDFPSNLKTNGTNNVTVHTNGGLFYEKTLRKTNGVLFNALIVKSYTFFDAKPALQYVIKQK